MSKTIWMSNSKMEWMPEVGVFRDNKGRHWIGAGETTPVGWRRLDVDAFTTGGHRVLQVEKETVH